MNIIRYDVKIPVTVRKHEVNIKGLQTLLRVKKKESGYSNKQIADKLGRPMTEVEHWFRTDKCFSIPQPELWFSLKDLLAIESNEYDEQVMEFVTVDGVYDQANRVYDIKGISPTLTVASEVLIIEESYESTYKDTWTRGELNGMKVNSFFCGAGGFDLGFIQAGFEIVGAYDFDKYAVESYNHNIGGAVQADVTQLKGEELKQANGWLFGFPCQDISVAGKQAGMIKGETRSGLFYEIMRLLGEVSDKPEWILAENVKAVNKFIPTIREEYEKAGYTLVDPQLYNSKYWLVPQNRERYFLFGIRSDLAQTFVFPEQQTDFIPKLSSILESNVDEKYYISNEKAAKIIEQAMARIELKNIHPCITPDRVDKRQNGRRAKDNEEEMYTLTAQDLHGVIIDPSHEKREGKYRIYEETSPTLNARDYKDPRMVMEQPELNMLGLLDMKGNETVRRVYDTEGLTPTLTTSEGGHRQPKILEASYSAEGVGTYNPKKPDGTQTYQQDRVYTVEGIAPSVTAELNGRMNIMEFPRYRVRKLTPREYARLQGFPDSYEQIVSNSQFYKQLGNAVTTTVSYAIAKAIKEQLHN